MKTRNRITDSLIYFSSRHYTYSVTVNKCIVTSLPNIDTYILLRIQEKCKDKIFPCNYALYNISIMLDLKIKFLFMNSKYLYLNLRRTEIFCSKWWYSKLSWTILWHISFLFQRKAWARHSGLLHMVNNISRGVKITTI